MPTAAEATFRAEAWLRERQMSQQGEVLVITGRGNASEGGVPVVKPAVEKLLFSLRRKGVVAAWREHTEGSLIVTLAPVTALFEAPRRRRERLPAAEIPPTTLSGLAPATVNLLRAVAVRSLESLGMASPASAFVRDEMLRIFSQISQALPESADREAAMSDALRQVLAELDA